MATVFDSINNIAGMLIGIVWSNWLVYLILAAGIIFTIITKGVQIRRIPVVLKMLIKRESHKEQDHISDFQAFMITVAARVGTGNIVGTAVGIAYGGPGAIFWMWVSAALGGATAFVESTISQVYKLEIDGEYRGGTTYFIDRALGMRWLAILFAILTALAFSVGGPGVHSNAMASALKISLNVNPSITGAVLVGLMAYVGLGGIKRLAKISEVVAPFISIAFLLMAAIIIVVNIASLPGVVAMIFASAFGADAIFGGIMGSALSWGIMRGIYSNEAGLGTATFPAAAAETSHPAKTGLVQAMSTFVDTLFICTATAFMILCTNSYNVLDSSGVAIVENLPGVEGGVGFAISAVDSVFKGAGGVLVTLMLCIFSFSSLMTAFYAAETNVAYIFKNPTLRKNVIWISRALVLLTTFYGTQVATSNVFMIADLGFGAMAWVNIIICLLLSKLVMRILGDYDSQLNKGLDPVFDPEKLGIKGAEIWNDIKLKYLDSNDEQKN